MAVRRPPAAVPAPPAADDAARAASSPLAVVFELVGCEFAVPQFLQDPATGQTAAIPTYQFSWPCVVGKATPDQDCRTCRHVRVMRVGVGGDPAAHRYLHDGLVVPVREADADAVLELLAGRGATPLARPAWQAHRDAETAVRAAHEDAARRRADLERQQASPGVVIPHTGG